MQLHVGFWFSGITQLGLGIVPMGFFPRTASFTNLSFVDAPDPLTGHSCLLHRLHVFVGTRGLPFVQASRYLQPTAPTICLQVAVDLCPVFRFTCPQLHMVPEGLPSYTPRTGSVRMDGRDVSGVIRCVPFTVFIGVGTQLPRRPAMTRHPKAGAGGGCYLFSFEVRPCEGRVICPVNPYRESVIVLRAPLFELVIPNTLMFYYTLNLPFQAQHSRGKNQLHFCLSAEGKPFLCYSTSPGPTISGFSL